MEISDYKVIVKGIKLYVSQGQLYDYVRQITGCLRYVGFCDFFGGETKSAKIIVSDYAAAYNVVKALNYSDYEGGQLVAHIEDDLWFSVRNNIKCSVCVKIQPGYNVPNDRSFFEEMCHFGMVHSCKSLPEKHVCLCTFYDEETAHNFCNNYAVAGRTASIKRARNLDHNGAKDTKKKAPLFKRVTYADVPIIVKKNGKGATSDNVPRASKKKKKTINPFILALRHNSSSSA